MKSLLFPALTLAGLSAAQSTTVSLFLPNTDHQSLVASVVGADATATTYAISCPPGTDASNCGYGGGATVIEGPSTLQLVLFSSNVPLETVACNLAGTTQAVCTTSETLQGYSTSQVVTSTLGQADITFFPVGITAGTEKLGPASTSVSAPASSTSGGVHSASTTTGLLGSISLAGSSTGVTTSTTELASGSSGTAASLSVSSTTGASGTSETQSGSSATSSSKNAASRTGEEPLSLLAVAVRSLFGGLLALTFL